MKKWQKGVALLCAGLMSVSTLASCKTDEGIIVEPTTINIRALKASWGVNWIYTLVEEFEKTYADKGWKVNVLQPSADIRNAVVVNELYMGYENSQVDMYITGGTQSTAVGAESEYGIIAEELSDIWEKAPIGFDGQNENTTLREKVIGGVYEESKDVYGKIYSIPYVRMTGGLVVNVDKLAMYGINELPTTTNEMFEMWDTIYRGNDLMENSKKSDLYPFTYMPGSVNGYTNDWFVAMMAQYDQDMMNEFWSWQTKTETGYDWWEGDVSGAINDSVMVMLETMARAFDTNLAARGTAMQSLDQAQAQIMKKDTGAIFMCNGSWYLNDMALGYKNSLNKITFINFPVVSQLADKIWADTVTDADKREQMLRYAIDEVDANTKTEATIAAEMTTKYATEVTEADVKEVMRARQVFSDRTVSGSNLTVAKGTPKREICEHFIRFIASDDAARVMAADANATSAFLKEKNTLSQYRFVQDASTIGMGEYAMGSSNEATGYRKALGRAGNFLAVGHLAAHIVSRTDSESMYDGKGGLSGKTVQVYKDVAEKIATAERTYYQEQIAGWEDNNQDRIAMYKQIYQDRGITIS